LDGKGQESGLDLADGTKWLEGQQGIATGRSLKDDVGP
jgi:hypothetical protein